MKLSINLFLALSVLMVAGGCVERIIDLTLSTPGDPEVLIRSALDLQAETSPETAARPMEGVE